ncbi:MAG: hypothetical protein KGY41_03615 [Desulfovermiculus sp.]|nr:hypothetical protein [Desulfovermiculus sp.]
MLNWKSLGVIQHAVWAIYESKLTCFSSERLITAAKLLIEGNITESGLNAAQKALEVVTANRTGRSWAA